jgi:hypothetical protein
LPPNMPSDANDSRRTVPDPRLPYRSDITWFKGPYRALPEVDVVGPAGLEPATDGLKVHSSTN